jgi:hypothetical protein
MKQHLMAVRQHAPGGEHCLARLPEMQPLGKPVDEQIGHLELRQIAAGKRLVFCPQRSVISLTAVRLNSDRPRSSANSASISRVDSPRAYISTANASSSSRKKSESSAAESPKHDDAVGGNHRV